MKVKLRDFQHRAAMFIKGLDKEEIILTQYNLPIAKVVSVDTKATPPPNSPDNFGAAPYFDQAKGTHAITKGDKENNVPSVTTTTKEWITQCEFRACRKDAIGNFKIVTYSTDTGDQTQTKNLCKLHKHLASKEGAVTEV